MKMKNYVPSFLQSDNQEVQIITRLHTMYFFFIDMKIKSETSK